MRRGIFFGAVAGAVWGAIFLAPALSPQFPPLLLSTGRYLMYGAVSLVLSWPWLRGMLARLTARDLALLTELALTGNLVYYLMVAYAVQLGGIARASLIVGATPVVIALLGRRDPGAAPLRRLALPFSLVLAGVIAIHLDLLLSESEDERPLGESLLGMAAATGAVASWSLFAVRNARFLRAETRFDSHQWSLLWGLVTATLSGLAWLFAASLDAATPSPGTTYDDWTRFWLVSLGLAVVCSWFGNTMWNAASKRLPLTLGGPMLVFETLFALLYGFLWEARLPRGLECLAVALLITGVVLSARTHAPAPTHVAES